MLEYIAAYIGGIATGLVLIGINRHSVNAALKKQKTQYDAELRSQKEQLSAELEGQRTRHDAELRNKNREISRLRGDYSDLERSFEARDISRKARAEGIEQGKRMGGAERFASGFETSRQTVEFRNTGKTA